MTTLFPLCGTVPGRVGLLKGAGNAIVPPLAAEFVKAYMDYKNGGGGYGTTRQCLGCPLDGTRCEGSCSWTVKIIDALEGKEVKDEAN